MKVILKALNGILKSKVMEIPDYYGPRLYFAHVNKRFHFININPIDTAQECLFKKLVFEPSGKVFGKGKNLVYEYELMEI